MPTTRLQFAPNPLQPVFKPSAPRKLISSGSPATCTLPTPVANSQNSSNSTSQLNLTQLITPSFLKHVFQLAFVTSRCPIFPTSLAPPSQSSLLASPSPSHLSVLGCFRAPGAQPSHLFSTYSFFHKTSSNHMALNTI